jgi:hypothetical protein
MLDPDTTMSPGSWDAARLAAAPPVEAVQATMTGRARNAFALVAPPGHHAEPDRAMGFCLLNNAAIAAEAARRAGAARVLIRRLGRSPRQRDAGHLRGARRRAVHVVHQYPFYPGRARRARWASARGAARRSTAHCPAARETPTTASCFTICSAGGAGVQTRSGDRVGGFDAHARDPLAGMRVTERGFAGMASLLASWPTRPAAARWPSCSRAATT